MSEVPLYASIPMYGPRKVLFLMSEALSLMGEVPLYVCIPMYGPRGALFLMSEALFLMSELPLYRTVSYEQGTPVLDCFLSAKFPCKGLSLMSEVLLQGCFL